MFELGVVVVVANDGDNVKAQHVDNAFGFDVVVGCIAYVAYLSQVDCIVGLSYNIACACLHLDKYDSSAVVSTGNDVDVAMANTPVAVENLVAIVLKIVSGILFAPFAEFVVTCHDE